MPEIKIQHVVSFSGEDKNHPANNLMIADGIHKWKCAKPGEKQAYVVLQFEKACVIHSIDIGNEGSAFVEVLVGRSGEMSDENYQVILVASSFMSPTDSRNGTNRNSVRMFGSEKLSKAVSQEKWDKVKIVVSQPFNKNITYGLSFVKFHSPPENENKTNNESQKSLKKLGAFTLKTDETSSSKLKIGSLFAKRKDMTAQPLLTDAAVTLATSQKTKGLKAGIGKQSVLSSPVLSKRKHSVSDDEKEDATETTVPTPRKYRSDITGCVTGHSAPPKKIRSESMKPSSSLPSKEFGKLMEDMVFVMSGYQNPYRRDLRDKALEMGAKYRPDWGQGCTHLVCAFTNTPKYNQVKGKGKIVTHQWILDCYKQKALHPWRKYRLGSAESPPESSDDDVSGEPEVREPILAKLTAVPSTSRSRERMVAEEESEEDTDDELRKIQETGGVSNSKTVSAQVGEELYDKSTDEDTTPDAGVKSNSDSESGLPELPEFFTDKHFLLYGEFSSSEQRLLLRYITAYNGEIEDYMGNKVNYVVTAVEWDNNFEEALNSHPDVLFVRPRWIYTCHEKNKLVPYQPYVVVPPISSHLLKWKRIAYNFCLPVSGTHLKTQRVSYCPHYIFSTNRFYCDDVDSSGDHQAEISPLDVAVAVQTAVVKRDKMLGCMSVEKISKHIHTLLDADISTDQVEKLICANPRLLNIPLKTWQDTIFCFQEYGFGAKELCRIFRESSFVINRKTVTRMFDCLQEVGITEKSLAKVITREPAILTVKPKSVMTRVVQLKNFFKTDDVINLIIYSPFILVDDWENINEKFHYVFSLGITQRQMMYSSLFSHSIEHIRARHLWVERCGIFRKSKFKEEMKLNPRLGEIVDTTDSDFARKFGDMTTQDYKTFCEMLVAEQPGNNYEEDFDDTDTEFDENKTL